MKIGIVGSAERAVAWEKHLRPHKSVREIVTTPDVNKIGNVDACLLIDDNPQENQILTDTIKKGIHTFLIAPLPIDRTYADQAYRVAEEANIQLQFSHWPTFAPASQWIFQQIKTPRFFQVVREISYSEFIERNHSLEYFWIDELALCLKWINGNVHHLDVKTVDIGSRKASAIHLHLRFDSGASAAIYINASASENRHHRLVADNSYIASCNVHAQEVRLGKEGSSGTLFFERKTFYASKTAELAAIQFLKAIQLKKPPLYNGYDLLQLCSVVENVKDRLHKFP